MTEAEDLELVFQVLEGRGEDMTLMRNAAASVSAMEVGDPTPLPGELRRPGPTELVLPPLHNGLNEPPEGKFYERHSSGLIVFSDPTYPGQRHVERQSKRIDRIVFWFQVFVMAALTFAICVTHSWRPGWP